MAKSEGSLEEISYKMERLYIKGNLVNAIIYSVGQNWLVELKKTKDKVQIFRIKS